jgi:hypothetical protein
MQTSSDAAHLVLFDNPPHHPNSDFLCPESHYALPSFPLPALLTFSGIGIYRHRCSATSARRHTRSRHCCARKSPQQSAANTTVAYG